MRYPLQYTKEMDMGPFPSLSMSQTASDCSTLLQNITSTTASLSAVQQLLNILAVTYAQNSSLSEEVRRSFLLPGSPARTENITFY